MAIRSQLTCPVKSDLYTGIPADQQTIITWGNSTFLDAPIQWWRYDSPSTATDDGTTVIKPTSIMLPNPGRWLLIPIGFTNADWNASSGSTFISNKPNIPSTVRTTSTLSLSLVGTGATGTQIGATKDSTVRCTVSTSTTSTIGGPATSVVLLKINSTNSATEGTWTTVATFESDRTVTLAVVLQSLQVVKGQLCADVPAGWYVKLVNSGTGTHAEAFVSGQQTIYG